MNRSVRLTARLGIGFVGAGSILSLEVTPLALLAPPRAHCNHSCCYDRSEQHEHQ